MKPVINKEECSGCGKCVDSCPTKALEIDQQKAALANVDLCMECGLCVSECLENAIRIND